MDRTEIPDRNMISKIFSEVTGMVVMPAVTNRGEFIEAIYSMLQYYGYQETYRRMKVAYDTWVKQRGKNGKPYSRTNLNWINYAVADETLGTPPEPTREEQILHDIEVMTRRNQ
jgi:hypothetical protein